MKIIPIFTLLTFILTSNIHSLVSAETLRPKMLFDSQAESKSAIIDYSDMMCVTDLADDEIKDKVVLVSADLNVGITSEDLRPEAMMRIRAIKEDLSYLLEKGAKKIVIMSHNGGRKNYREGLEDGEVDPDYSLRRIADTLTGLLSHEPLFRGRSVLFAEDCIGEKTRELIERAPDGSFILLENLRFHNAETSKNDKEVYEFAGKIQEAVQAEVFVNAGAGAMHRGEQASKGVVSRYIKGPKVLGILVKKELKILHEIASNPKRKVVGIFGGAKLDGGKLETIEKLIETKTVDRIVIVGKMAFPFFIDGEEGRTSAIKIREMAAANGIELIIPTRVVTVKIPENTNAEDFIKLLKTNPPAKLKTILYAIDKVPEGYIALDVSLNGLLGLENILKNALDRANTIIYNGTAGLNESNEFAAGTNVMIDVLKDFKEKNNEAILIGLGGDGVKAILAHLGQEEADEVFDVLSTMGGAALVYLSGKELSAMEWIDNKKLATQI